jgi:hypothetical protein
MNPFEYDFGFNSYSVDPYTGHLRRNRGITLDFASESESIYSIPGLKGIVEIPPTPAQPVKAAVKFPLSTDSRRFRED